MHTQSTRRTLSSRLFTALIASSLAWSVGAGRAAAADGNPDAVAQQAYAFFKKYCHNCHGVNEEVAGFRILDRDVLIAPVVRGKKLPYVDVAHSAQPEKSLLWIKVVKNKSMPPSYADPAEFPTPGDEERKVVEAWIRSGALFPTSKSRNPVSDAAVVVAVRDHLRGLDNSIERRNQRYLILTNLHNNRSVTEDQLRNQRAAASLVLNSLSWRRKVQVPKAIDESQVILNFDLRWYGWTPETWDLIASKYPYGIAHREDRRIRETEEEIVSLAGHDVAVVRADWFTVTVSQSPLYDRVLGLPDTLAELEKTKLSIDSQKNFVDDELARAGMVTSNVSLNNRMVERHETPYGAYWRSFDFVSSDLRGNIVRYPLGPKFAGNPFARHAFEQAGGEVIFNLPNGLQGYMLADAKDRRLNGPAPVTIVRDRGEKAGSPQIVNGLSCMSCHKDGMIDCVDVIRERPAVFGDSADKVRRIFATADQLKELLDVDRKRFLDALDLACGAFLKTDEARDHKISDFPEPVSEAALLYLKDLSLDSAAAELGLTSADALRSRIEANDRLREVGLGPLLASGGLKRQLWERSPLSLFHQICPEFGLTPIIVLR